MRERCESEFSEAGDLTLVAFIQIQAADGEGNFGKLFPNPPRSKINSYLLFREVYMYCI